LIDNAKISVSIGGVISQVVQFTCLGGSGLAGELKAGRGDVAKSSAMPIVEEKSDTTRQRSILLF